MLCLLQIPPIKHTLNTITSTDADLYYSQIEVIKSQICNPSDIHKWINQLHMHVTETSNKWDIESIAKPSWLRIRLSSPLEHHLAYRCLVLYHHGGDLVHVLSMSLLKIIIEIILTNLSAGWIMTYA